MLSYKPAISLQLPAAQIYPGVPSCLRFQDLLLPTAVVYRCLLVWKPSLEKKKVNQLQSSCLWTRIALSRGGEIGRAGSILSMASQALLLLVLLILPLLAVLPSGAEGYDRFLASQFIHRPHDGVVISANDPQTGESYSVVYQTDCNLCGYRGEDRGVAYWCWTEQAPTAACSGMYFGYNGNLEIFYETGATAWTTNTAQPGSLQPWTFRIKPNGTFGIYSPVDPIPIWSQDYTPPAVNNTPKIATS